MEPTWPPAERRAQVLSRMPLAAPARSAGSSWTRPSTALSFPGWATTASPKSATLWVSYGCVEPIGQQSIVLRRPLEFTLRTPTQLGVVRQSINTTRPPPASHLHSGATPRAYPTVEEGTTVSSEFRRLRSAQSDFESAVSEYESERSTNFYPSQGTIAAPATASVARSIPPRTFSCGERTIAAMSR